MLTDNCWEISTVGRLISQMYKMYHFINNDRKRYTDLFLFIIFFFFLLRKWKSDRVGNYYEFRQKKRSITLIS
jgi:hypothetical protein